MYNLLDLIRQTDLWYFDKQICGTLTNRLYLSRKVDRKNIYSHLVFLEVYISNVFHSVVFSKVDRGSSTEGGISSSLHAPSRLDATGQKKKRTEARFHLISLDSLYKVGVGDCVVVAFLLPCCCSKLIKLVDECLPVLWSKLSCSGKELCKTLLIVCLEVVARNRH